MFVSHSSLDRTLKIVDVAVMTTSQPPADTELAAHFEFGANWRRFLSLVDEDRIAEAERSLRSFLQLGDADAPLAGQRFLDAGCGSGLFSLAAVRLGADVTSFDLDPNSVACANQLKDRFAAGTTKWTIQEASILDRNFLNSLGTFNTVYSWGVLHHTGAMWDAIDAVAVCTSPGGQFFLAIYNDQGSRSRIWWGIKRLYVSLPSLLQTPYVVVVGSFYYAARAATGLAAKIGATLIGGQQPGTNAPFSITRSGDRGMSRWYDLVDWIGGYPFEVATPDQLLAYLSKRGFRLEMMRTVGGKLGCNEIVFRKSD